MPFFWKACQCLWDLQELDLKVRQFELLLHAPPALAATPNINLLWARLMVEELCRLGASTFCIAPGAPEEAPLLPLKKGRHSKQIAARW